MSDDLKRGECGLCGGPGALLINVARGCCTQLCARCVQVAVGVHAQAGKVVWAEKKAEHDKAKALERAYLAGSVRPGEG